MPSPTWKLLAVLALAPGALPAQSLAGTWDAAMNTPGGVVEFGLVFHVQGDTVTGTVKRSQGDVPLSGVVVGDTVSFSYTITYNDHPFDLTMTARIVGDSLKGTVDFEGQGSDLFWARRVKEPEHNPPSSRSSPASLNFVSSLSSVASFAIVRSRSAAPSPRRR
ncbi:MAG: hypothetical protein ACREL5_05435 [Gemmatimonadales bacterium]